MYAVVFKYTLNDGTIAKAKHGGIFGSAVDDSPGLGFARHWATNVHSRFGALGINPAQYSDGNPDDGALDGKQWTVMFE